ncbi:serine hydrolase domain-containing protein [Anaerocolumna sp. MB42-C2]|uniref:serine hydrolase domain-containing protein n=1 Tax=Anaerocolumna sp. MB42-C2 TaxID=3070997 RepID=UPI0027E048DB|nr:serine hydrolase domain-containing protein [Anaerocolumna sp. MB42-C2]WMJ86015.1 serine hydrolase domain-containing protein [Anaerocolumna sp. MB42-C2]
MHENAIKHVTGLILLVCMICFSSVSVTAKETEINPDYSKMDSFIEKEMRTCRIPGLSLGIVKGNEIIYRKGYGIADPTGRKVMPQTPFKIASLSKSFTAMAVMQLAEAQKLDLDKPVQTFIPGFHLSDKTAASEITVRNLLNHTSGIGSGEDYVFDTLWDDSVTLNEYINRISRIKPGKKLFQYGNISYNILGKVIENVTGLSYGEYISENIFKPLDMNHSYVSQEQAKAEEMAVGYRTLFGIPVPVEYPYQIYNLPAAGIISSSEDISKYIIALLNGGNYNHRQILSESGVTGLMTPSVKISEYVSYGLGWYVTSGSVYHGGEFTNYQSKVKLLPEDSIGVVIMYNTSSIVFTRLFRTGYRDRIESGIISILYGYEPDSVQPGSGIFDLNRYPMSVTYTIYIGLYLFIGILLLISAIRLKNFYPGLQKYKKNIYMKLIYTMLIQVFLPVLAVVLLPVITGMPWSFIVFYVPDLGYFILLSAGIDLLLGIIKVILFTKYFKTGRDKNM